MVVNDAEDFALHRVVGRDVDGLVISPDHKREGDNDVNTTCKFLHRGILNSLSVYDGASAAGPLARRRIPDSRGLLTGPDLVQGPASRSNPEIVTALQADPELGGVAKVAAQAQSGVSGNAALATHKIVNPRSRDMQFLGQPVSRQTERFHELRAEDFSRMN